jgi:hypothetical protein
MRVLAIAVRPTAMMPIPTSTAPLRAEGGSVRGSSEAIENEWAGNKKSPLHGTTDSCFEAGFFR